MGAAIAPVAQLVGGAISAYGTYQGMEAQSASAAYKAQVAANNSATAKQKAEMERQSGEIAASNSELKTRAAVGRTMAGQSASGVDVNSGSFVASRSSEAELGMLDAMTIRSNAAKRAWSDDVAASSFQAESNLERATSEQEKDAAPIATVGSLLSSAGSAAGSYYSYLKSSPMAISGV